MLLSVVFLAILIVALWSTGPWLAAASPSSDASGSAATGAGDPTPALDPQTFREPPSRYRGWAMWGLDLSRMTTPEAVAEGVRALARTGYGGFFMVASHASGANLDPQYVRQGRPFFGLTDGGVEYLSEEFFRLYRAGLEEGHRQGLNVIFYDDYYFPTGSVCGQLYMTCPQHMAKRLDMVAKDVAGPGRVEMRFPRGTHIGAVLMNTITFERVDVSDRKTADGRLVADVPAGAWKAMIFYLDVDAVLHIRNPGIVDYLDGAAVDAFLSLSYERFYDRLKKYFGPLIQMAFYDEPSMHWLDGRMWTAGFNQGFQSRHGYSPMTLYPALWYDIGPDTASARNALYGYRADLFGAFLARLDAWCAGHGIQLTGHLDQEEVPNPVPINGDLMKAFEHQAVPGADDIFWWGRSNRGYKVVTSSAFNYDKPITMTETYAAYEKVDDRILLKAAMDQFAQGVNFQCPTAGIEKRATNVRELNRYTGRMSYLLQGGRHVADVAVLYPIASLQACYRFQEPLRRPDGSQDSAGATDPNAAWTYGYTGGILPPEIDYMDVGERLFFALRVDYTYLHPEVLENRCLVRKDRLVLDNPVNREEYRLLLVPGGDTLRAATARKIQAFYEHGGTIVATSRLPLRSAEFGRDRDVRAAMSAVFGVSADEIARGVVPADPAKGYRGTSNSAGGRAYFLPKAEPHLLEAVLRQAIPVRDVEFREPPWPLKRTDVLDGTLSYVHKPDVPTLGEDLEVYDGALSYIHKVKAGRDVYFFANSSDRPVDTEVVLRGEHTLRIWNPHTGAIGAAQATHGQIGGAKVTVVRLVLPPVSSLFYVGEASGKGGP